MQTLQHRNKMWKNNAEKRDANAIYTFVKLFLQLNPLCNLHKKCKLFCKIGINSEFLPETDCFGIFSGSDAPKAKDERHSPTNSVGKLKKLLGTKKALFRRQKERTFFTSRNSTEYVKRTQQMPDGNHKQKTVLHLLKMNKYKSKRTKI